MDDQELRKVQNERGWSDPHMLTLALNFIVETDNGEAFRSYLAADHSARAAGTADEGEVRGRDNFGSGSASAEELLFLRSLNFDPPHRRLLYVVGDHGDCVEADGLKDETPAVRWEQWLTEDAYLYVERRSPDEAWSYIHFEMDGEDVSSTPKILRELRAWAMALSPEDLKNLHPLLRP